MFARALVSRVNVATRPVVRNTVIRSLATQGRPPKTSTGLVGLEVDPEAREKLVHIYKQTLDEAQKLKLEVKEDIVAITKYRLGVVEKFKDPEQIESEIQCGQIEEILEQAKDELGLVRWLIENAQDKKLTKREKELAMLTTGESS